MSEMSDKAAPTKTISDFEAKLEEADRNVASFDLGNESLLQKARSIRQPFRPSFCWPAFLPLVPSPIIS
jgi:hypothetical protein